MPLGNPIRKQNESRIISVLATEWQSVFTVEGGYIINQISVFRNGVRLSNSEDFTAGDGSTVTLNNEANVDDRIEFHIFDRFTVQNAIVGAASSQTINGDLVLTGKLFGNLDVPSINTGITTTALLDVGNLTNGRVVYVGSNSGRLVDSGNLTFDGTTLSISGLNATGVTTVGKQIHVGTGVSIAAGGLNVTAGISTFQAVTGTTAAFFLLDLARNPDKQKILYQEILNVIGDGCITEKKLNQMKYLKACLHESQRLNPAVFGSSRTTQTDMVIEGYHVPKGVWVSYCIMLAMRDPKQFLEPTKFQPERWLRGCPSHHNAHPFATAIFSHGPRMCIGRRFAELECYILAIKMLQRFKLEYHHEPVAVATEFVNKPDKKIKMRFISRN